VIARGPYRLSSALSVVVLAATLLVVPQEAARADETPELVTADRSRVLMLWEAGGALVKPAAEQALLGTDDDVRTFLSQVGDLQGTDDRIAAVQVYSSGGPTVRAVALQAIDADKTADFLTSGWQTAAHSDQRIRVTQMLSAGGPQLRKAAQKALDADQTSPLDDADMDATPSGPLDDFLSTGWRAPDLLDRRVKVTQIYAHAPANSNVQRLAQRALDTDTAESLGDFLDSGYAIAAARDEEATTVGDLVAVALQAGADAEQQLSIAQDQSARATAAASEARKSALAALADMSSAGDNATKAAAAARKAQQAADQAAAAADQAMAASRDAVTLARAAAAAAARASALAALTRRSANQAYKAAAAAAVDKTKAQAARDAAKAAKGAGDQAKASITALQRVNQIAAEGQKVVDAARAARDDAEAAASAADEAVTLAKRTGVNVAAAENAARKAHERAAEADRAAAAATKFAAVAVDASATAVDAANRAADDAISAASNAIDAADHAGDATRAANVATNAADAATKSAEDAVTAANKAYQVYDAARTVDAARISVLADQGAEAARDQLAAYNSYSARANQIAQESAKRDAETNRLLAEARSPDTEPAVAIADGRHVALAVAENGAANSQVAAKAALSGSDDEVLAYVQNGIDGAADQDDRAAVEALALNGTLGQYEAAARALVGTDDQVRAFLKDPVYPGRGTDDRIAVTQLLAQAQNNGNTVTVQRAQKALDGDDALVHVFLTTGRFAAADVDEQVQANRVLASTSPGTELYAAATNALDGPPAMLHEFVTSGQYTAAQNDLDAQEHEEEMLALLQKGLAAAKTATQNSEEAQSVAATARGKADVAKTWADRAVTSAQLAVTYMDDARASAQQAEDSAVQAVASQEAAVKAADRAMKAAQDATRSANRAQASYDHAANAAREAVKAGLRARDDAKAAGKSATEVAKLYKESVQHYNKVAENEWLDELHDQQAQCLSQGLPTASFQKECFKVYEPSGLQAARATLNRQFCESFTRQDSDYYRACVADAFNPLFMVNRATDMVASEVAILKGITVALGGVDSLAVLALGCAAVCTAGMAVLGGAEISQGIGGMFELWLSEESAQYAAGAAIGGVTGARILDELESVVGQIRLPAAFNRVAVPTTALDADLARLFARVGGCVGNSFMPATPVLLADGSTKPIEDVRVGDYVLATDPESDLTRAEPVTNLIKGAGQKKLVDVVVDVDGDYGNATASIAATYNHPFWVADLRQWRNATELQPGDWLRTSSGTWVRVTALRPHTEVATVYNFAVAGLHTYYVVVGGVPVLVHNEVPCIRDLALGYRKSGLREWAGNSGRRYDQYLDLPEGQWEAPVQAAIQNSDGVFLRVLTDGFATGGSVVVNTDPHLDKFLTAAFNGFAAKPDATEREMFWIVRSLYNGDRAGWKNIKLYDRNGELPALPDEDWWNLFQNYAKRPTTDVERVEFERRNKLFKFLLDPVKYEEEYPNG